MNRTPTRTRTLLALALAIPLGLALAQGMMGTPNTPRTPGNGYGNGYGNNGGYGMTQSGYGPGGTGMMGGGMMSGGMMSDLPPDAEPLDDAELRARLDAAARDFGPDARVDDVMPFTDHTYAQFIGPDGTGLAEVLVNRYTGAVTPEPGPNMMWNLRTGRDGDGRGARGMGGYGMGPWGATPNTPEERYDEAGARDLATTFLDGYLPGAEVLAGQTFPGYATFDYGRDGRIDGMLSVHLGNGQIWPHTWHGAALDDTHD